jgi:hypothetical protein
VVKRPWSTGRETGRKGGATVIRPTDGWCGERFQYLVTCPVCGFDYAHHREVAVFDRAREDAPTVKRWPGVAGGVLSRENPSPRRNAVRVWFEGECGHEWALDIVQHKGQTFIFLREAGRW